MNATNLTNAILLAITERYGRTVIAWRANVLTALLPGKDGTLRTVRAGLPGQADISGIGPRGVRIEIEVKAGKDRMRDTQIAFKNMVVSCGGIYIEGRSVEQVMGELERELRAR